MSEIDRYQEMKDIQLFLNETFSTCVNTFTYRVSRSNNNIIVNVPYLDRNGDVTRTSLCYHDVADCVCEALNELSLNIHNKAMEIFEQKMQKQKQKAKEEAEALLKAIR